MGLVSGLDWAVLIGTITFIVGYGAWKTRGAIDMAAYFRGDYSLLMKDNIPKASYNVAKIFNGLSGKWISITGTDGDVSGVASWDEAGGRLAIVLVNFRDRYALRRPVRVQVDDLPAALRAGIWQEWIIDATHSNVWHDQGKAELATTQAGKVSGDNFAWEKILEANSVTLIEVNRP